MPLELCICICICASVWLYLLQSIFCVLSKCLPQRIIHPVVSSIRFLFLIFSSTLRAFLRYLSWNLLVCRSGQQLGWRNACLAEGMREKDLFADPNFLVSVFSFFSIFVTRPSLASVCVCALHIGCTRCTWRIGTWKMVWPTKTGSQSAGNRAAKKQKERKRKEKNVD